VDLDFSKPLTPRELAVIAVVANPDLKAARAKAAVSDAQAFNAGLLPDPQINLSYAYRLSGPDPANGMAGGVIYELMALRQRRTVLEGQTALARQARLDLAWQELQTAGQAELLAARITGLTTALQYAERTQSTAANALQRALTAQARGDIRADEVETRRLAASDSSAAARVAEIALDTARHDLNRLLGLSPDVKLAIASQPPVKAPDEDADTFFEQAKVQRLDLQALQAGSESQNAVVRKAMMDAFPSLQLTVARTQDTARNQTVDPALNFTLPLWNRNRGGIAIAKATQAQLHQEYAARLFTTRADIAELVAQLRIEAQQRDAIERQLAPIRPIVAATDAAVQRGDLAIATAETARQSVADKEFALATLNQSMAEQRVTLQLAVGGPLVD
jgi:outer membrane protein TolC